MASDNELPLITEDDIKSTLAYKYSWEYARKKQITRIKMKRHKWYGQVGIGIAMIIGLVTLAVFFWVGL